MRAMENNVACVLTVAGSDSGGGAGIQADLKTFTALNVYGASVITALTAQNTRGVQGVQVVDASFVEQQLESVLSDLQVTAVKTGMLPNIGIIQVTVQNIKRYKVGIVVVDPVMVATSGDKLIDENDVMDTLMSELFPLATVVTPNIPEAEAISGMKIKNTDDARKACRKMVDELGYRSVLLKGGHITEWDAKVDNSGGSEEDGNGDATNIQASDILYDGKRFDAFSAPWVETKNTHGTGCTLASAIAACLARGQSLKEAVKTAKQFVWQGISSDLNVGHGNGPLYHMHTVQQFDASN